MPKKTRLYKASYAYDVPHYFDITVEATSEAAALRQMKEALKAGKFKWTNGQPDDSQFNERVFISEERTDEPLGEPRLINGEIVCD